MKLKKCPFCGGKAELRSPKKMGNSRSAFCSVVSCTSCGVDGRASWPWVKSVHYEYIPRNMQDEEAIRNWNERKR